MGGCAGFELIAIENTTTRGDDLLEIGKGREAQMIGPMRHGSPPRLMAPQSIRSADLRESSPTPSPGNRITPTLTLNPYHRNRATPRHWSAC
jgi:hypothetical protein